MTTHLSKIYENLPPEQLALLAFNHLADDDDLERERILSVVPRQTLMMHDWHFIKHSGRLGTIAHMIGISYWRAQAAFYMRSFAWLHQQHQTESSQLDDDAIVEAYRDIEQQIDTAAAKLIATERAINDFMVDYGINPEVVQRLTMTSSDFDISESLIALEERKSIKICSEQYTMIYEMLEGLLSI